MGNSTRIGTGSHRQGRCEMKLYGYTCPVCGGKKGRQFNHEKCSQIMKAQTVKHRKKQHQNYDYIMKMDLNTQHLRLE